MRITNAMMTTGMLNNIMSNKADMNRKFDQYATRQKIQKPSDDPVIAIRSLKYRENISETKQYLEKNTEDAKSWMELTESALVNMNSLLTDLYDKCAAGATDTYETIDRQSMEIQLMHFKEEIYNNLNADHAGRYLFSGYRTNTSVCYTEEDSSKLYNISEPLAFQHMYEKTYVDGGAKYDPLLSAEDYKAQAPTTARAYVIDLGYKDIEGYTELSFYNADGTVEKSAAGKIKIGNVEVPITEMDSTDANAFKFVDGTGAAVSGIHILKDTGQIVVSDDLYEDLRQSNGLQLSYDKKNFEKGDVRPEMYYDCTSWEVDKDGNTKADTKKLHKKPQDQDIEYNVNFGQKLKVNVLACDTINSAYARSIDNILNAVNDAYDTQTKIENVKLLMSDSNKTEDEMKALQSLQEQLDTELTLKKSILRETFASAQTTTKAAQNGANVAEYDKDLGKVMVKKVGVNIATTSMGSRVVRLELVQSRLTDMKTSYSELQNNNDGVDLEEAAINYNAANVTYTASLNAASRVVQNSLLDFLK